MIDNIHGLVSFEPAGSQRLERRATREKFYCGLVRLVGIRTRRLRRTWRTATLAQVYAKRAAAKAEGMFCRGKQQGT